MFERAAQEWETRPTQQWVELYGREIGNLRAALDWAFSPDGAPHDGIALTVAAVPLWFQLSLVDERLARVKQAVHALQQQNAPDKRQLMQLNVVLGWPQMSPIPGMESGPAAWRTTLKLAEELGDADYQLRALWALWVDRTNSGEPRDALDFAERFCILANATAGIADQSIGWRMRGRSLQLLGDQAEALSYTRRMLEAYAPPANRSHLVRFQYDQRVMARGTLARILWTQGYPEQALADIAGNVEETLAEGDLVSLCHALSDAACPIALLSGETELARRYTELLRSHTTQGALDVWQTYGECFSGVVMVRGGSVEPGLALLKAGIARLGTTGFALHRAAFLGFHAEGLLENGRLDGGGGGGGTGACGVRAQRGSLVACRALSPQGRDTAPGQRRRGGRGCPAPRHGDRTRPERACLGAAHRHQPRPAVERDRPGGRSARAARRGDGAVHRGLCHGRLHRGGDAGAGAVADPRGGAGRGAELRPSCHVILEVRAQRASKDAEARWRPSDGGHPSRLG